MEALSILVALGPLVFFMLAAVAWAAYAQARDRRRALRPAFERAGALDAGESLVFDELWRLRFEGSGVTLSRPRLDSLPANTKLVLGSELVSPADTVGAALDSDHRGTSLHFDETDLKGALPVLLAALFPDDSWASIAQSWDVSAARIDESGVELVLSPAPGIVVDASDEGPIDLIVRQLLGCLRAIDSATSVAPEKVWARLIEASPGRTRVNALLRLDSTYRRFPERESAWTRVVETTDAKELIMIFDVASKEANRRFSQSKRINICNAHRGRLHGLDKIFDPEVLLEDALDRDHRVSALRGFMQERSGKRLTDLVGQLLEQDSNWLVPVAELSASAGWVPGAKLLTHRSPGLWSGQGEVVRSLSKLLEKRPELRRGSAWSALEDYFLAVIEHANPDAAMAATAPLGGYGTGEALRRLQHLDRRNPTAITLARTAILSRGVSADDDYDPLTSGGLTVVGDEAQEGAMTLKESEE